MTRTLLLPLVLLLAAPLTVAAQSHYCGVEHGPEEHAALTAFQQARAAGTLPRLAKTSQPPDLGDEQEFRVLENSAWVPRTFTLRDKTSAYYLWVENQQLGSVSDSEIAGLREAMLERTPGGSFDSGVGIMTNIHAVLGRAPNYDGDGFVDILLYDIGSPGTLGYVTGQDLNPADDNNNGIPDAAENNQGNQADVLYLDAVQGTRNLTTLAAIAAHEYTHLVHFNYGFDNQTFISEGIAEYAMVLTGYGNWRAITYLSEPTEYVQPLFTWREGGGPGARDYERSGLFSTYLAEQIGAFEAGHIIRNQQKGAAGYDSVLVANGLSLREAVVDFHTTNFVNDPDAGLAFAYTTPGRENLRAAPISVVDASQVTPNVEDVATLRLNAGAVRYLVWDNVETFAFFADVPEPPFPLRPEDIRPNFAINLYFEHADGRREVVPFALSQDPQRFEGSFDRVVAVMTHARPEGSPTILEYIAAWGDTQIGGSTEVGSVVALQYDQGQVQPNTYFTLDAAQSTRIATRFDVPGAAAMSLQNMDLAPFFQNQFASSELPASAPRDLTLTIHHVAADGTPGDVIVSATIQDPRPFAEVTNRNLAFFSVGFEELGVVLNNLPPSVFISLSDAGADVNYLTAAAAGYAQENVSYVFADTGFWQPLWDVTLPNTDEGSGASLASMAYPIRATFRVTAVATANDTAPEVSASVDLLPNYPNPFNPSTTIAYEIPQPTDVRLAVYDMLGREITILADGMQPSGRHEVTFNATNLSSGLYLYRLEAAGQTQTRSMLLVK